MEKVRRFAFVACSCMVFLLAAAPAGARKGRLEARLRQGYNDNIFETGDIPGAPKVSAYFGRVDLSYLPASFGASRAFRIRPTGYFKWVPDATSGNALGVAFVGRFRRNVKRRAMDGSSRKSTFAFEVSGAYDRALFLRRPVREELRVGTVSPDLAMGDLPDRFTGRLEFKSARRVARGTVLGGGVFGQFRDYSDSSDPTVPRYDKLDHGDLGFYANASRRANDNVKFNLEAAWRTRTYWNRNARDLQGVSVGGENRHFWFWDLGASTVIRSRDVRNKMFGTYRHRTDRFQGYYAYDQWSVGNRIEFDFGKRLDVTAQYAYGRRDYDVYAPAGAPSKNTWHDVRGEVEFKVAHSTWITVIPKYENSNSNDPVFDYSNFTIYGEFRVKR